MRYMTLLLIAILALGLADTAQADKGQDYSKTIQLYQGAKITQPFFANAYGYAVFPVVGKGAIGIGGAFGEGQVYRSGKATGKAKLVQLSLGFQLGGKAFSEIIFFKDQRAYDEFTGGSFEFAATASAVAITAAAQAQAGSTGATVGVSAGPATGQQLGAKYVKGMAIFVHTKGGLMYEAALGGQKFFFEPYK